MIPLDYYLILAALVFGISMGGIVINRKNVITLLMCIAVSYAHLTLPTILLV